MDADRCKELCLRIVSKFNLKVSEVVGITTDAAYVMVKIKKSNCSYLFIVVFVGCFFQTYGRCGQPTKSYMRSKGMSYADGGTFTRK